MNLIALLVSLLIERLATQYFHWRRMRWMDRIIDAGFERMASFSHWPPMVPVALLATLLVLPVALVTFALGDSLLGFPYLLLAITVLFFSLGPNDIGEDVDEYCAAIERDDEEAVRQASRALIEGDVPAEARARIHAVESAVLVQANNRLFAVIFWFVALGPLGPLGAVGVSSYRPDTAPRGLQRRPADRRGARGARRHPQCGDRAACVAGMDSGTVHRHRLRGCRSFRRRAAGLAFCPRGAEDVDRRGQRDAALDGRQGRDGPAGA